MSTAKERAPDREGYLGFKDAIDNGNEALAQRVGTLWWELTTPKTEIGHYNDLYLIQGFIDKHFNSSEHEGIAAYASTRMSEIRSPALRERVASRIERLSKGWHSAKIAARRAYAESHSNSLETDIAARQVRNPHETESQSWFIVKQDADSKHLDYLDDLQKKFERGVDKQLGRALASEATILVAAARARARQASTRQNQRDQSEKDLDRD